MAPVLFIIVVGAVLTVAFARTMTRSGPAALTRNVSTTGDVVEGHYHVNGKPFECTVCGSTEFTQRTAQLNTAGATFFGFDWANESARCLVCRSCGYVHWFVV